MNTRVSKRETTMTHLGVLLLCLPENLLRLVRDQHGVGEIGNPGEADNDKLAVIVDLESRVTTFQ